MVLVNNNNILSLNKFQESRSANKNEIRKITLNFDKIKKQYIETPEEVREPDTKYIDTIDNLFVQKPISIYIPPSYEQTKKSYNTTMFDPSRKYSDK
jgi:hypothetical protein